MEIGTAKNPPKRISSLFDHVGSLLLALILALIVWLIAINRENPTITQAFPEPIEIDIRGLAPNLDVVQDLEGESIRPILQGPQSAWENLDVNDITAYIDLERLGEGTHDVAVEIEILDPKVSMIDAGRSQLRITLDPVILKSLPVEVRILENAAIGYEWQSPVVEPMTVTVSGPATHVNEVGHAEATISIYNAKQQVDESRTVQAQSQSNRVINGVAIEPPSVRVIVPVSPRPGRKEVAVRPKLTGSPNTGYRLSAVKVEPSTVILSGANEDLTSVPGFVETAPITLTGAVEEVQKWVSLILPANVTVLGTDRAFVTASIAPLEGGATVQRKPILTAVGDGLDVKVALDAVDVILRGPLPMLDELSDEDVQVILNLDGLLPGVHVIQPEVSLPEGISQEGLLPETVEVVITVHNDETQNTILPPTPTPPFVSPLAQP